MDALQQLAGHPGTSRFPWNAKPDAGRLADGIPPSNFWPSGPSGVDQMGSADTPQGFKFNCIGVTRGGDVRWDRATDGWVGVARYSHDSIVKRSGNCSSEPGKRTYRVLLSGGVNGCYVCVEDKPTQHSFEDRMGAGPSG